MTSVEIFVLGTNFVINLGLLFLGYLKLVKPQAEAREKETEILRKMAESMIRIHEREAMNHEDHAIIKQDLLKIMNTLSDRSRFCSWTNSGSDRLTDKIAKETVRQFGK